MNNKGKRCTHRTAKGKLCKNRSVMEGSAICEVHFRKIVKDVVEGRKEVLEGLK